MNVVKRLWTPASGGCEEGDDRSETCQGQHRVLALNHLNKLFDEYIKLSAGLVERDLNVRLYNMLPLFSKVFSDCSGEEIAIKFPHHLQLCEISSKLMVSEIRLRAFNQNTTLASLDIIRFLECDNSDAANADSIASDQTNGWVLLSTLHLLSTIGASTLQVMVTSMLPSTLVKCLYLFFDLPEIGSDSMQSSAIESVMGGHPATEGGVRTATGCQWPSDSTCRDAVQKVFVQLLLRLCSVPSTCEQLCRRDDLSLLFSAISCSCAGHNISWRKAAAELLMALCRPSLQMSTIHYIHNKGCIALCLDNLRSCDEVAPLDVVETFVALFCFMKDSAELGSQLFDDLKSCQGYVFMVDFLVKLERCGDICQSVDAARNLVLLLASLTMCGYVQLEPSQIATNQPFRLAGFSMPQPSGLGTSVRNVRAFSVLQTVFLRASSVSLCMVILEAISSVYHADRANYFILESQHTISQLSEKIHLKPQQVQERFFQLLQSVVFQLNYVPVKELISCSIVLKSHGTSYQQCCLICSNTLLMILRYSPVFKDVYREVGVLEVFVQCLAHYTEHVLLRHFSCDQPCVSAVFHHPSSNILTTACISSTCNSISTCPSSIAVSSVVTTALSSASTSVSDSVTSASTSVSDSVTSASTSVSDSVTSAFTSVSDSVTSASTSVCDSVTSASTSVSDSVTSASTSVSDSITSASTSVSGSVTSVSTPVSDSVTSASTVQCSNSGAVSADSADDPGSTCFKQTGECLDCALGGVTVQILCSLLSSSASNCSVFRQTGGVQRLVQLLHCSSNVRGANNVSLAQRHALDIYQHLLLCPGGEAEMLELLSFVHDTFIFSAKLPEAADDAKILEKGQEGELSTAAPDFTHERAPSDNEILNFSLNICVLKLLFVCLRESHRARAAFRKVGGFVYAMSVLVSMEGCLSHTVPAHWSGVSRKSLLQLIRVVFELMSAAMRYEPANAKLFLTEVCSTGGLLDTVKLLGCFGDYLKFSDYRAIHRYTQNESGPILSDFCRIFTSEDITSVDVTAESSICACLLNVCMMFRLLFDTALDSFDRPRLASELITERVGTTASSKPSGSPESSERRTTPPSALCLSPPLQNEPLIVHSGVVVTMLHLLPAVITHHHHHHQLKQQQYTQMASALQVFLADVLKALLRYERNQQLMCDSGFLGDLLDKCSGVLLDDSHSLHSHVQYMLERISAHALQPCEFRVFLRLGSPLLCEGFSTDGGAVQLSRIKTLVSMTTPRDSKQTGTVMVPPFVEFDMSLEGFGCLFLPSVAPHSAPAGGTDSALSGGIGSGDRVFPPTTGLSFSTWFCVERYANVRADAHCVRLLTLVRHPHGKEEHLVCLAVLLSARDKALIVSTKEIDMPEQGAFDWEPEVRSDTCLRVWCPALLEAGRWHHLVVTLNRALLKNSSGCVFVDGRQVACQKLNYISQNPGGGAASLPSASSVYAFIGTPPLWRRHSRLLWKQGCCVLVEEPLNAVTVNTIFRLGPNYLGTLQAPSFAPGECGGSSLVPEERVVFALNSTASSQLTLAKIRRVYTRLDNRSIAKQLGMSSQENATPIRILHNAAGHLIGQGRSLGGVAIGYLGVRIFCARPVARVIENIGATSVLLGLVAMATDASTLYASVKALTCVVKTNSTVQQEMDQSGGYQKMAMLLRQKCHLLNNHIQHLLIELAGTEDICPRGITIIGNVPAFVELLCNLTMWCEAPGDLSRSLFDHLAELASDRLNQSLLKDLCMVARLLQILRDFQFGDDTQQALVKLLSILVARPDHRADIVLFGQFLASTLPLNDSSERDISLISGEAGGEQTVDSESRMRRLILLRNSCFCHVVCQFEAAETGSIDEWFSHLGYDWLLLFIQNHVHVSSVILAARLLFSMISSSGQLLSRFRDGVCCGGWLIISDTAVRSRLLSAVLGYQMGIPAPCTPSSSSSTAQLVGAAATIGSHSSLTKEPHSAGTCVHSPVGDNTSVGGIGSGVALISVVPGFQQLSWQLQLLTGVGQLSLMLLQLFLSGQVHPPRIDTLFSNQQIKLSREVIFESLGGTRRAGKMRLPIASTIVPEAVVCLFSLARAHMSFDSTSEQPVVIVDFVRYLYHQHVELRTALCNAEVLTAIGTSLFGQARRELAQTSPSITDKAVADCAFDASLDEAEGVMVDAPGSQDGELLTSHPASVHILDLLRVAVLDTLYLPPSRITPPTIDVLLEISPDGCSAVEQGKFQSLILCSIMDFLHSADSLIGDNGVLSIATGGSCQNVPVNVFYVVSRLVDKLWQGVFCRNPHQILSFIIKLVCQSRRWPYTAGTDVVFRSLNRTILYILSRPVSSLADQLSVLEALHVLTNQRALIFGADNHDPEFFGCLVYCLLQLTADMRIVTELESRTVWHANPSAGETLNQNTITADGVAVSGHNLTKNAAARVWSEMYIWKRPTVEEVFKVSLPLQDNSAPKLDCVRDTVQETASRIWFGFLELERKSSYRPPWELQGQLQTVSSKLQRMTGGLTRLAQRTRHRYTAALPSVSASSALPSAPSSSAAGVAAVVGSVMGDDTARARRYWLGSSTELFKHVNQQLTFVRQSVAAQLRQLTQSQRFMDDYVEEEWYNIEEELVRERGIWGPETPNSFSKWRLDSIEGPCRMRKRTVLDTTFYLRYPYRPRLELEENRSVKYKVPVSLDAKAHYHSSCRSAVPAGARRPSLLAAPRATNTTDGVYAPEFVSSAPRLSTISAVSSDCSDIGQKMREAGISARLRRRRLNSDVDDETMQTCEAATSSSVDLSSDSCDLSAVFVPDTSADTTPDAQNMLSLLERGEKVSHIYRCARIQGLDAVEGLLLFGREHLYVVDGYTVVRGREIRDISNVTPGQFDPIVPVQAGTESAPKRTGDRRSVYKMAYDDIREVNKRRYLLQPMAVELFSADGRSYLLAFQPKSRLKIHQRILSLATRVTDTQESMSGQKSSANVDQSLGLFSSLIGDTSVTQRWVRGEMSNFQYLMHLNTLAGRSYNDLMQYPVFPWVLSDYHSQTLDLYSPRTFRDLSKPMGAQSDARLAQFHKRYEEWDDPSGETPPYHYGTHYSSAMIVASFMMRLEPFTSHFLRLQGGHFDLADRMFHSVADSWKSASKQNMADVKELIPEFFYLPEFLVNSNRFDLGTKQNGTVLDDVVLPPWAKEDPREFIRVHREALECSYVSSRLHLWIDLIFGCKQQGSAAVEASNVFHYLFYEGNVDINSIEDPLKRNATIGFINNFGQIPKQLFRRPHPQRRCEMSCGSSATGLHPVPVAQASSGPSGGSGSLHPGRITSRLVEAAWQGTSGGSGDGRPFFRFLNHLKSSPTPVKELKGPIGHMAVTERGVTAVEQNKYMMPGTLGRYVAWGFADASIRVASCDSEKVLMVSEPMYSGEILCCVVPRPRLIITAGTSTVVTVYECERRRLNVRARLYGHTEPVLSLAASTSYSIVVSGSRDLTCIIWDLYRLRFVRQLRGHCAPVATVAINDITGDIASSAGTWLHVWTVNGAEVARVNTAVACTIPSPPVSTSALQQILCICFSQYSEWDSANVIITGSTDGVVRFWSLEYVQQPEEDTTVVSSPSPVPPAGGSGAQQPRSARAEEIVRRLSTAGLEAREFGGLAAPGSLCEGRSGGESTTPPPSSVSIRLSSVGGGLVSKTAPSTGSETRRASATVRRQPALLALPEHSLDDISIGYSESNDDVKHDTVSCSHLVSAHTITGAGSDRVAASTQHSPSPLSDRDGSVRSASNDTLRTSHSACNIAGEAKQRRSNRSTISSQSTGFTPSLPDGFCWRCQLVFRSKLTMHTAYQRQENKYPASVTTLAISKDHKTLYVGDSRGRVWMWTVADNQVGGCSSRRLFAGTS